MRQSMKIPVMIYDENKFCPGCGHGIVVKLIAKVLEELSLTEMSIGIIGVGCSCLVPETLGMDWIQAQHGRAPAVAAGVKLFRPGNFVFTYQGDGDAGAIGLAETLYFARRNENITTFFINNGVFGMTGGQMAPTSLKGQKTTTTKYGRDIGKTGSPLKLAELVSIFEAAYVARGSLSNYKEIRKTEGYIEKAVKCQLGGKGYSFVEILSPCPTNWKLKPVESVERLENAVADYFPCGELKVEV